MAQTGHRVPVETVLFDRVPLVERGEWHPIAPCAVQVLGLLFISVYLLTDSLVAVDNIWASGTLVDWPCISLLAAAAGQRHI
jgi:hypothetical protein